MRSTLEILRDAPSDEEVRDLAEAPEGEEIMLDYASLGLTLRRHPMALLRDRLTERKLVTARSSTTCRTDASSTTAAS